MRYASDDEECRLYEGKATVVDEQRTTVLVMRTIKKRVPSPNARSHTLVHCSLVSLLCFDYDLTDLWLQLGHPVGKTPASPVRETDQPASAITERQCGK